MASEKEKGGDNPTPHVQEPSTQEAGELPRTTHQSKPHQEQSTSAPRLRLRDIPPTTGQVRLPLSPSHPDYYTSSSSDDDEEGEADEDEDDDIDKLEDKKPALRRAKSSGSNEQVSKVEHGDEGKAARRGSGEGEEEGSGQAERNIIPGIMNLVIRSRQVS